MPLLSTDKKPNPQIKYSDSNVKVDVTNEEEVRAFFDGLGRPADILINNAGQGVYTDSRKNACGVHVVLETNLLSVMLMTNNFLFFHPPKTGHVINISLFMDIDPQITAFMAKVSEITQKPTQLLKPGLSQ